MKNAMIKSLLAAIIVAGSTFTVHAEEFTRGLVKKVDAKAGKVTLIHEELKDLEMPAMTMVFRVEDKALLDRMPAGGSIEFVAERVNGKLVVTKVK